MGPRHLEEDQRVTRVLDAASALIETHGVTGVTMSMIAAESEITRQWLYHFFPDIESVLTAIYARVGGVFIHDPTHPPPRPINVNAHLKGRCEVWLQMPAAPALVGLHVYSHLGITDAPRGRLAAEVQSSLEAIWIDPLVEGGLPRDEVTATALTVHIGMLALVLARHRGDLEVDGARQRMFGLIDATVPDWWCLA